MKCGMGCSQLAEKEAVASGYWHLYRYNPAKNDNPFTLDSKTPDGSFQSFLRGQNRYRSLQLSFPEKADALYEKAERDAAERLARYRLLAGE